MRGRFLLLALVLGCSTGGDLPPYQEDARPPLDGGGDAFAPHDAVDPDPDVIDGGPRDATPEVAADVKRDVPHDAAPTPPDYDIPEVAEDVDSPCPDVPRDTSGDVYSDTSSADVPQPPQDAQHDTQDGNDVPTDTAPDGGVPHDPYEHMLPVPTGAFWMGCNTAVDDACRANEHPYHEVLVPAFLIDRLEVTQAAYAECVAAGACTPPSMRVECAWDPGERAEYPVSCVNWEQARTYCAWADKRLCSEAEWEKAARGADGRLYPWGNNPPTCDLMHNSACGTAPLPVGMRPAGASPYGVEDMAGNVREWVEDDWHGSYDGAPSDGSAWLGDPRSDGRVRRGCCFAGGGGSLRTSARVGVWATHDCSCMGIRCCADAPKQER